MTSPGLVRTRPLWEPAYAAILVIVDAVMVTAACAAAVRVSFQVSDPTFTTSLVSSSRTIPYGLLIGAVPPAWVATIAASQAYEAKLLGVGSEEFKRVFNASVRFVAVIALLSYTFKAQVARSFVATAVPLGLVLLLLGRFVGRKVLHHLRGRHRCLHRVVLVGDLDEIEALAGQMTREPYAGLEAVAVALPDYLPDQEVVVGGKRLPNIGPARALAGRLAWVRGDTVAVAGTSAMSATELRELSWALERSAADLLVAPAITDVTGPRIHIRPVAGLPLLHVESPTFGGPRRLVKRVIDVAASVALLLLLLVPFAVIALAIRLEGRGPVFFRQDRVGREGSTFCMWKFRSMRPDATAMLAELGDRNEAAGPLFKMVQDPRVTRVGAFLRRYSLDELPQLLNVLRGQMSLVGPRPPLPSEVEVYADHVHRRLLAKPGMTGLWQVSGRSDLTWDESVRLDLYYVENWSVALDAQILWKTLFAVLGSRGAY